MITRREFLATATAAAVLSPTLVLGADPLARIQVGFLGTTYSHFREKYALVRSSADFELVGLCEEDTAGKAAGPVDARWLSREKLFAEAAVVIVESIPRDHARHAKLALEAGCHVHLEKPPADTMEAFREIVGLARERRRILQIGYMWRYNPGMSRAIEAARNGWLGEVFLVRATMNTHLDAKRRPEWAEFKGGALFEQGSHLVDALVRTLGRPTRITSFLQQTGLFPDTLADNTIAIFEFPRAQGIVTNATLQPNAAPHRLFEILGTKGVARVQPLEPPALMLDLAEAAGPYAKGRHEIPLPEYRRYVDEFADLAAAVRNGRPLPVSLDTELDIHEALMRACRQ